MKKILYLAVLVLLGEAVSAEIAVTGESEVNCPTAQSMANVTGILKEARSARGVEAAMYSGMIRGHGCSVLTKGIRLEVIEKIRVTNTNWLVILGRLPTGMTTYIAREQRGSRSSKPSRAKPGSRSSKPSRAKILELQKALKKAGYDPGPIDGIWGVRTARALKAYRRDHPDE